MLEKTDINIFKYIKFGPNVYVCTREISLNYMYELIRYSKNTNSKIHIVISETEQLYERLFAIKYDYNDEMFSKIFDIVEYLRKEIGKTINIYHFSENNTFNIVSNNIILGGEKLYKNEENVNYSFISNKEDSEKMCKYIEFNILPYAKNINGNILAIINLVDATLLDNNVLGFVQYFINEYSAPENTVQYFKNLEESKIWQTLFSFQRDGVIDLINKLEKERGAFLCDDVGLGKTYQTLALIKYFSLFGTSTIVFAPKNLLGNWERYVKGYKSEFSEDVLEMQVFKHTCISIPSLFEAFIEKYSFNHIGLVVIDEAHFYRNNSTIGYKNFLIFLKKCNPNVKVLMISATPINNNIMDLENLTKIALSKSPYGKEKIHIISNYRRKEKNEYEYKKVVSDLVIRRTRSDIKLNYGDNLSFPKVIRNNIFSTTNVEEVAKEIEKIANLRIYENNTQLINLLLFKRLESSFVAFSNTIKKIMNGNIITIEEEGYEIEELDVINDNNNFQILTELLESKVLKKQSLEKENSLIDEVRKIIAKGEKVLIFSCYKDTTEHLYEIFASQNLDIGIITGEYTNSTFGYANKEDILDYFSPNSRNTKVKKEINILVATDVISEGQNLQDCSNVIHYDLHWNPVRQIQREGRVNRIGSKNSTILSTTFWPTASIDEYLKLKDRIEYKQKIGQIDSSGIDLFNQNTNIDEDIVEYSTEIINQFDQELLINMYGLQGYIETNEIKCDYLLLIENSGKYIFTMINGKEKSIVNTSTMQQLNEVLGNEKIEQIKLDLPQKIKNIEGRKILILEIRGKNE